MSTVKKVAKAREAIASSVAAVREDLAQMEARREELIERRAVIEAAPVDQAAAEGQIGDLIAALAGKAALPAHWLTQGPTGYAALLRELAPGLGPNAPAPPSPWAALAAVAPDALTALLRQRLRDSYDQLPAPMTADRRAAALAEVERELATVEGRMAEAWWEALDAEVQLPLPEIGGAALAGLEPAA